jgi:hypothetical protein
MGSATVSTLTEDCYSPAFAWQISGSQAHIAMCAHALTLFANVSSVAKFEATGPLFASVCTEFSGTLLDGLRRHCSAHYCQQ